MLFLNEYERRLRGYYANEKVTNWERDENPNNNIYYLFMIQN
jgi:hypothetical protein